MPGLVRAPTENQRIPGGQAEPRTADRLGGTTTPVVESPKGGLGRPSPPQLADKRDRD